MVREGGSSTQTRDLDLAGFAQEFLRRNPAYARDYRKLMFGRAQSFLIEQEEMARRWGLSFPVCAGHFRVSPTRALAADVARLDRHTRCSTSRN
ncbi:transcriptional regulator domain-containing protein [Novosphingobium sp. BW1]|uniref:transcriptional regulator domain-containing protein n=1 Tax=Novosphingobium sp. BW1 TaxID=2592621 RepID=UPI00352C9C81